MQKGYCTVADVRRVLQKSDLPGDIAKETQLAVDAIAAQTEWLRKITDCHFYVEGGLDESTAVNIPESADSREAEELDVPSTPHPQHSTLFVSRQDRYPHKTHGPYCRIPLAKHDVSALTSLQVYGAGGQPDDWVASGSGMTEGEDYRLYVEPGSAPSRSYLDVRARSLPPLHNFDGAVRVSYEYGDDELPRTIRRAVAFRAASDFVEDAAFQIPENAQIYDVESLAEQYERKAEELLEVYQ